MGSAVIGVSTVAPVYCLTSTLGSTAGEVGVQMPAVFLAGFLPMLLVAFAYRELNRAMPDCGTSFTWTVKAFGPRVGWMCGWGLVIATIIVLSNLAGVATSYFWLLAGRSPAVRRSPPWTTASPSTSSPAWSSSPSPPPSATGA